MEGNNQEPVEQKPVAEPAPVEPKQEPVKPQFSQEDYQRLEASILAKAKEDVSIQRGEIEREIKAQLARSLTGDNSNSQDDIKNRLLASWINNPDDMINAIKSQATKEALSLIEERDADKANRVDAINRVFKGREDIKTSPEACSLVEGLFNRQDSSLSYEERYKKAVGEYDALMEKNGAGSAQDRLAKMATLTGKTSNSSGSKEPAIVDEKEMMRQEMQARRERHLKLRGEL